MSSCSNCHLFGWVYLQRGSPQLCYTCTHMNICTRYHSLSVLKKRERGGRGGGRRWGGIIRLGEGNWFEESQEQWSGWGWWGGGRGGFEKAEEDRCTWGSCWGGAGGGGGMDTHTIWTYHATTDCSWPSWSNSFLARFPCGLSHTFIFPQVEKWRFFHNSSWSGFPTFFAQFGLSLSYMGWPRLVGSLKF